MKKPCQSQFVCRVGLIVVMGVTLLMRDAHLSLAGLRAQESEPAQPMVAPTPYGQESPLPSSTTTAPGVEAIAPAPQVTSQMPATAPARARPIQLRSRVFTPEPLQPTDRPALQRLARSGADRLHALLQLDYIPREAAKSELARRGIHLLAYVPDYAWIASLPGAHPEAVLEVPGMVWAGELTVDDKLAPAIRAGEWAAYNMAADGTVAVYVVMHADESLEAGRALVAALGGKVINEVIGINTLVAEMPAAQIRALAAQDAVQWVEPAEPALREANDDIRARIAVSEVQAAPYNLNGTNVDILIYDGGVVTYTPSTHADFTGRLTIGAGETSGVSDHATHVAGTAAGSGALSASAGGTPLEWRGMAPSARIISYAYNPNGTGMFFYNDPGDIENNWAAAQNVYGADIGSASLGSNIYANYPLSCTLMGNYGVSSALLDQMIRGGNSVVGIGDKYIATWAVGNERGSPTSCGTYATISPPAAAKNPIHVGASDKSDAMSAFSSWGPTDDGRVKPTIVATGVSIRSTIPNRYTNNTTRDCDGTGDDYCYPYDTMSGTSMATPAVAGSIALMLQHYRAVYGTSGNFWPSTAKAILIHTATDRGNPGPDYQWGYGLVNIRRAVDLISARGFFQRSLSQGNIDYYTFVVPTGTLTATVTIAWDDIEATFNASPTLINNLDLQLVSPDGVIVYPWVLDPLNPSAAATRGVDNRNNQEQAQVFNPQPGTWIARVRGTTVPVGPQDYTLVCNGCRLLDVGVCQSTAVGGLPPFGTLVAQALTPAGATLARSAEDNAEVSAQSWGNDAALELLTAGEQWQRGLEVGPAPDAQAERARQDALAETLRAFDQAREAGPEALIAFAETASPETQAMIAGEVELARARLAGAAPQSDALAPAGAQQVNRVGVNGPCAYPTIQAAINAAPDGATVRVPGQFFAENLVISGGKVITIEGGYDAACASLVAGARARVDAVTSASTVDVYDDGTRVVLRNLVIGWGSGFGAGVDVYGRTQATLDNVRVVNNNGASGGGLYVGSSAVVTLTNGTQIERNTAGGLGGGVAVYGILRGYTTNTDLTTNCAAGDGGNAFVSGGTLFFDNADTYAGLAAGAASRGGGIYAADAVITLTNSSFLGETAPCCNRAAQGGGLFATNSAVWLLGSATTVLANRATGDGGGIYLTNRSHLTATGALVGHTASESAGNWSDGNGGGMYVLSSTVSGALRVYNNRAVSGGGIYATASTIALANTEVGGTNTNQPNRAGFNGAGLYLSGLTTATLDSAVISSNTLTNTSTGYGGGIYLVSSVLTMTNSRIERHVAPSAADGRGAGMYLFNARATLSNTVVQSNTANAVGGGARLWGQSRLTILGGSAFLNNRALNGEGGAIAAAGTATITLSNGALRYNSASTDGGAVSIAAGQFNASGEWDIRFNQAGRHGGAVYADSPAHLSFQATGPGDSYLAVNSAAGNGGALYTSGDKTVPLYSISGALLALNTNQASGNGGALYGRDATHFDLYGRLQASSNHAGGNGGVAYLENGARIWLDDYAIYRPQIWVNWAANGGAIYALNGRVECDGADFGAALYGNRAESGSGGALYVSATQVLADNCVFRNNRAEAGNGGAIAAHAGSTVTLDTDYPMLLLAQSASARDRAWATGEGWAGPASLLGPLATPCDPLAGPCAALYANQAISSTSANGNGGAIYTQDSLLSANNLLLRLNQAARGGAIYQEGSAARSWLSNTLIYSNTSLLLFGAGIRNAGGAMTLTHVTTARNVGGAGYSPGAAQSYVYNTIIWGNSSAAFGALTEAICNIDQGGVAGPSVDPLFVSPGGGENYRLRPGSPARDACAIRLPRDMDNWPRPIGPQADMGVYEMPMMVFAPVVLR